MTVVGRDQYSADMILGRRYRFASCSRCTAKSTAEAEVLCTPWQDMSGDYSCPGDESGLNPFSLRWDQKGRACILTNSSAKQEARALDEWCREQAARDVREALR